MFLPRTPNKLGVENQSKIIVFFCVGLATWGKKVGKKWDQLKRSDSSEILQVSPNRRRQWSPVSKANVDGQDLDRRQSYVDILYGGQQTRRLSRIESVKDAEKPPAAEENNQDWLKEKCQKGLDDLYAMEKKSLKVKKNPRQTMPAQKTKLPAGVDESPLEQQCILDYLVSNKSVLGLEHGVVDRLHTLGYDDLVRLFNQVTDRANEAFYLKNRRRRHTSFGEALTLNKIDEGNRVVVKADESGYESDSTRNGGDSPRGSIKSQSSVDNDEFSRKKNFRLGLRRGDVKQLQAGSIAETASLVCDECSKKPEQNMSLYQRFLSKKNSCVGPNNGGKHAETKTIRFNKRPGEDAGVSVECRDPCSRSRSIFITALSGPAAR